MMAINEKIALVLGDSGSLSIARMMQMTGISPMSVSEALSNG